MTANYFLVAAVTSAVVVTMLVVVVAAKSVRVVVELAHYKVKNCLVTSALYAGVD